MARGCLDCSAWRELPAPSMGQDRVRLCVVSPPPWYKLLQAVPLPMQGRGTALFAIHPNGGPAECSVPSAAARVARRLGALVIFEPVCEDERCTSNQRSRDHWAFLD